jgi:hypothetical protein
VNHSAKRIGLAAMIAGVALAWGCGGGGGGGGAATPEAAYKQFQDAIKAKDYGKAYDTASPKAQQDLVRTAVFAVTILYKDDASMQSVVRQYGLAAGAGDAAPGSSVSDRTAKMAGTLSNPRQFYADAMAAMERSLTKDGGGPPADMHPPTLSGVKVDGDRASGQVDVGRGITMTTEFTRVNGRWYLDGQRSDRPH